MLVVVPGTPEQVRKGKIGNCNSPVAMIKIQHNKKGGREKLVQFTLDFCFDFVLLFSRVKVGNAD